MMHQNCHTYSVFHIIGPPCSYHIKTDHLHDKGSSDDTFSKFSNFFKFSNFGLKVSKSRKQLLCYFSHKDSITITYANFALFDFFQEQGKSASLILTKGFQYYEIRQHLCRYKLL